MKKLFVAAALATMIVMPALAQQEQKKTASDMPAQVKAEIKAKCVQKYPDSYGLQDYCIGNEVEAWVKVQNFF